jgi:hypothetical protein
MRIEQDPADGEQLEVEEIDNDDDAVYEDEYEVASENDEEEQDKDFNYNFRDQKFKNAFVVRMPDGSLQIATQVLPSNTVSAY